MACSTPGIPNQLHKNGKVLDPDFTQDYKLFIRVRPDNFIEGTDHTGNKVNRVSANAFSSNKQSCNRDKYSVPTDVLYNTNALSIKDHHLTWGVVSLGIAELMNKQFQHPEIAHYFRIYPGHDPLDCMYPHTEIIIYNTSGESKKNVEVNSRKLKAEIKGHFLDVLTVEVLPKDK